MYTYIYIYIHYIYILMQPAGPLAGRPRDRPAPRGGTSRPSPGRAVAAASS